MPLRNLGPVEAGDYLDRRGIDPALHARLFEVSHGRPLGLSLLAEVAAAGGEGEAVDPLAPDLVGTLVRRFIEACPTRCTGGRVERIVADLWDQELHASN